MKKFVSILAILSLALCVTPAMAEDEKTSTPASSPSSHEMHSGKGGNQGMMMPCPMMKQHRDIKAILRQVLDLQKRSVAASSEEKLNIGKEIDALIQKVDAMPDKMDCPMVQMKQGDSSGQKGLSGDRAKEKARPSEHKH